ncbi:MAG: ABC transporter ATP-binding protein [Deltaproteobacteria bacterium]|nr:ABC transporter ATP-binding protein [Deltaproteobacteria bacterium]
MSEALLQVHHLNKRFGGLTAVNDVSLSVAPGQLHAVIGPNGAGKTTLTNLLSGDLLPTSGTIIFHGHDISAFPPEKRSRLGIGRSYQKTNIFPSFTALENCRLAAQSRAPRPLNWLRSANGYEDILAGSQRALDTVGLSPRADDPALALSHGEQRQLEIAMCLATEPQLLLLDEPLAGMGTEESQRMVALLGRLAESHAVLLIEHDMDAVFALAKVLTVMVDGQVLASGTPAQIRSNPEVQRAYLGEIEP